MLQIFLMFCSVILAQLLIPSNIYAVAGVVYGVCDKDNAWPYRKEREASEELYFGLKTAQGLLEFKCQNKLHKQKWVDGIDMLLRRVNTVEATEHSLEYLSISSST